MVNYKSRVYGTGLNGILGGQRQHQSKHISEYSPLGLLEAAPKESMEDKRSSKHQSTVLLGRFTSRQLLDRTEFLCPAYSWGFDRNPPSIRC